jgi:uncharacterized membrane protein YhiD involved in acid resistance
MENFLTAFGAAQWLGLEQILTAFLMSFILTSVIAQVYRLTFSSLSYSRTFIHTMVLGSLIITMVIMAIGNNLARGLGILGTLAIVRFRTPIRDPRDMVFLFAAMGLGIACGANVYGIAVVGTIVISTAALLLHWSPFASRREHEALLRFILPSGAESEHEVQDAMQEHCSAFSLVAMREAAQGDNIEYMYHVRLMDPSAHSALIDKIHAIKDVSEPTLTMQRTTVEL